MSRWRAALQVEQVMEDGLFSKAYVDYSRADLRIEESAGSAGHDAARPAALVGYRAGRAVLRAPESRHTAGGVIKTHILDRNTVS